MAVQVVVGRAVGKVAGVHAGVAVAVPLGVVEQVVRVDHAVVVAVDRGVALDVQRVDHAVAVAVEGGVVAKVAGVGAVVAIGVGGEADGVGVGAAAGDLGDVGGGAWGVDLAVVVPAPSDKLRRSLRPRRSSQPRGYSRRQQHRMHHAAARDPCSALNTRARTLRALRARERIGPHPTRTDATTGVASANHFKRLQQLVHDVHVRHLHRRQRFRSEIARNLGSRNVARSRCGANAIHPIRSRFGQ